MQYRREIAVGLQWTLQKRDHKVSWHQCWAKWSATNGVSTDFLQNAAGAAATAAAATSEICVSVAAAKTSDVFEVFGRF